VQDEIVMSSERGNFCPLGHRLKSVHSTQRKEAIFAVREDLFFLRVARTGREALIIASNFAKVDKKRLQTQVQIVYIAVWMIIQ